jgi:hypothetical protein
VQLCVSIFSPFQPYDLSYYPVPTTHAGDRKKKVNVEAPRGGEKSISTVMQISRASSKFGISRIMTDVYCLADVFLDKITSSIIDCIKKASSSTF